MSEQDTKQVSVGTDAVDFALGGEVDKTDHSPEENPVEQPEASGAPFAEDDTPEFLKEAEKAEKKEQKEDSPKAEDSAKAAPQGEDLTKRLQEEINTLAKRLHDTQKAMHEATSDRKKLQAELDELRKKESDDDDWFSEDDRRKVSDLESKIEENDKKVEELDGVAAQAVWDSAAAQVKAQYADFEQVVYEKFAPMLGDGPEGNPTVRKMWEDQPDKSPAAAYKFAKSLESRLEMQTDPDKYRERIKAEVIAEIAKEKQNAEPADTSVRGKDGLDMLNSADSGSAPVPSNESFVDFVFK